MSSTRPAQGTATSARLPRPLPARMPTCRTRWLLPPRRQAAPSSTPAPNLPNPNRTSLSQPPGNHREILNEENRTMPKSTFTRTLPLVAVAATLAVAGCGGGSSGSAATSGTVQGAITYSFLGSPARADKVNKVIALYQQKTPGVTVTGEVSDYNSYIEKLTVKAAGGGLACAIGTQSTFYAPYA